MYRGPTKISLFKLDEEDGEPDGELVGSGGDAGDDDAANPSLVVANMTPAHINVHLVPTPANPTAIMESLPPREILQFTAVPPTLWLITDNNDNILFVHELGKCYVVVESSDVAITVNA